MKYFYFYIMLFVFSISLFSEKHVLIVHSYHLGYLWTDDIQKGIMETFSKEDIDIDFHIEYMDTKRINNSEHMKKLTDLLINKYRNIPIDVIISSDDNAYNFLKDNYTSFFPRVPIILCGVNYFEEDEIKEYPFLKVVNEEANIKENIELIFSLHRNIKELVFITDTTITGKKIRKEFEKDITMIDSNIKITILDNLSFADLQNEVEHLPNDSIILYSFFFRDTEGTFVEYDESALKITEASRVPVYGLWDFSLGYGIMGGLLTSGFSQGENSAIMAIKILNGAKIEDIDNILESPNSYFFDYQQFDKYGLKTNILPKDSLIINKPYSVVDFYMGNKSFVLTFLLIGTLIILVVLIQSYLQIIKSKKKISLSEKHYKTIFENTGNATVIIENDNIISLANTNFCKLIGLSKEEIEGKKRWLDFTPKEDIIWMENYHTARRESNNNIPISYESHLIDNNNKTKNILIKIDLLPETKKSVASIIDITERKMIEEQLSQAHKMEAVGQLAGGLAHDFNNSLAGIIGATEMIRSGICDEISKKRYLDMIISSVKRAAELTQKLLLFSRKGDQKSSIVDMIGMVNETVDLLEHTIDKNISFSIVNKSTNTMILGDKSMLQNAIINLAINSSHAMVMGGEIVFTLKNITLDSEYCKVSSFEIEPREYLEIDISDTGTGMSPEIQSHIFEPFFTTKEQGKGTGIGLTTVYGTVKDHKGAINVYSEEGTGTVFHLFFPITEDEVKNTKQGNIVKGSGTILVIDDDIIIRETSKSILNSLGYKVLCAEDGKIGVKIFSENSDDIDLILLDMIMPVMGGRETLGKLREINNNIPVIICSGFAKDSDLEQLDSKGISGFLNKPFLLAELSEAIAKVLVKH